MKRAGNRARLAGFAVALGLFGFVAWLNWRHTSRMERTAEHVARTHEVQAGLNRMLSLLADIETGARGFVITGDPAYLEPYERGLQTVTEHQRKLGQLVQDARQRANLSALEPLVAERIALARRAVESRRHTGFAAAQAEIARGEGKVVMDGIREHFSRMDEVEQELLEQRAVAARDEADKTRLVTAAGTGLCLVLLVTVFALMVRENRLRQQSEQSLLANKRELEAAVRAKELIMRHSPDVICTIDGAGRFVFVSAASERLWGYAPADLVGKKYIDFVHADDVPKTNQAAADVMAGRPASDFENQYRRKDGTLVPVVWSAVWSESDRIMFCVARDVTARKEAERAIGRLNDELRQRAEALESANRELEAFSYTVSHDLRAPLRHIDGFAAKLRRHLGEDRLDDTGRRLLATIADSARSMGVLIDDLLAFARLGRAEMRRVRVNLDELVTECRRALEGETAGRTLTWQVAPLPAAEGDAALLRQVFANLLGNAVKYTGRRTAARIEIGTRAGASGEVVVFVRDNGAGFDMQYAGKLFGVFQRLHAGSEFEGTGIGLANVRRIVERHGGRIWAEGVVDRGATFYFSLPAAPLP